MEGEARYGYRDSWGEQRQGCRFEEELALDIRPLRKPKDAGPIHVECCTIVSHAKVGHLDGAKLAELLGYYSGNLRELVRHGHEE